MNERYFITVPGSLTLWLLAFLALSLAANRDVISKPNGLQNITVRLVSMESHPAQQPTPTPPKPVEQPVIKKPPINPVKAAKRVETPPPAPLPDKPKETHQQTQSTPQQALSEAKTDSKGPTIIYQPLPQIPDDLRHDAYSAQATVRFRVGEDGHAQPELLTPSQNVRLNHLLLETLQTWKFNPATENGKPIASTFDIRVKLVVE